MNENQTLLTVYECADILHISVSSFWRRVREGVIPQPIKFGSLSRWKRSDILDAIEQASQERNRQAA